MNQLEQTLSEAAVWIFDAVMALPARADSEACAAETTSATIQFSGPYAGRLEVRLCDRLLPVAAARMLGDTEPPDEAIQLDALGEIANMICGRLLPGIAPEAVFEMTPPRICSTAEVEAAADSQRQVRSLLGVDEGRAELVLDLDSP